MGKTFHNFCSRSKNRSRNYVAAPLRLTTKKYPDNFLGEAVHPALTADARTSYNSNWNKSSIRSSKLTPQTSETSFSSSKIETSHLFVNKGSSAKLKAASGEPTCGSFKSHFMRFFKSGLGHNHTNQPRLSKVSHTISNSSLRDTDEMDLVCTDLVNHMKQVNELL